MNLLFVCTGNATRSVIAAGLVAGARPEWTVRSAGTVVIEGLPLSWRTHSALDVVGLAAGGHQSTQLRAEHLADIDLVVCAARDHVRWLRRRHPEIADRAATLRRLVRDLPGPPPRLAERVASLQLDRVEPQPWEDLDDPGGGELDEFLTCARDIGELVPQLLERIG